MQLPLLPTPDTWPEVDARSRGTVFLPLTVRSVLNAPASTKMPFWSINPYVGCEFGCTYCYARETHQWSMERRSSPPSPDRERGPGGEGSAERGLGGEAVDMPPWLAFEKRILVKSEAPEVLATTFHPAEVKGRTIVIGTATDPYQPAERHFRLTRRILEHFLRYEGLSLGVITKSPLVARDAELLAELSKKHRVKVLISCASLDGELLRRIEARSPAPHARIRALKALTDKGVTVGLLVAPVIPGITDGRAALEALLRAAREAGATSASGQALRLGPAARARFLPHLQREFPDLYTRYQRRYAGRHGPGKDYEAAMKARFTKLRKLLGFPGGAEMEPGRVELTRIATTPQISITDEMFRRATATAHHEDTKGTEGPWPSGGLRDTSEH
jgi:DNA repair photolyase